METMEEQCEWQCWSQMRAEEEIKNGQLEVLARKKVTSVKVKAVSDVQKGQETAESWQMFWLRCKPSPTLQFWCVMALQDNSLTLPDRTTDHCQKHWWCLDTVRPSHLLSTPPTEPALTALLLSYTYISSSGQWFLISAGFFIKQNTLILHTTLLWGKDFCNSRDAFMSDLILPQQREISATADRKWFSLPNILLLLAN